MTVIMKQLESFDESAEAEPATAVYDKVIAGKKEKEKRRGC